MRISRIRRFFGTWGIDCNADNVAIFFTSCEGMPAQKYSSRSRCRIRRRIATIVVDSAANETLAVELGRYSADVPPACQAGVMAPLTPNCKLLVRDKAHGGRRLASRPFAAIPVLNENVRRFGHARSSPGQLIHWSPELRILWAKMVKRWGFAPKVLNLRAAKHRYESFAKPTGRSALNIVALFNFLLACLTRRDAVRKAAAGFLIWVSSARCVLDAMIADCMDELMLIIRLSDSEQPAIEVLSSALYAFFRRLLWMYGGDRGVLSSSSYTRHVIEILTGRRFTWTIGSSIYTLGGRAPSAGELDKCFDAMRAFVKLCIYECRAEFPDWECFQCVRVFSGLVVQHACDALVRGYGLPAGAYC